MTVSLEKITADFLALRGESPDLLPLLDEGEEGAVLTLARELKARLLPAATEATLALPAERCEEIKTNHGGIEFDDSGAGYIALPDDFLKFYLLRMADWREPVRALEPEDSLRRALGANAPSWMIAPCRPMVTLERKDSGLHLRVLGTTADSRELRYVPRPLVNGDTLTICENAYPLLLSLLDKQIDPD